MSLTIPRMVLERAATHPGRTALRRKEEGGYRDLSWGALEERVRQYGQALLALGIQPGDRVGIMAPNGPEWVFFDMGAMAAGAVSAPIYHTEGIETLVHILGDSASRVLFLASPVIARALLDHLPELPALERVILSDGGPSHPKYLELDAFLGLAGEGGKDSLAARLDGLRPEDPATIIYTSGTTGRPKGVVLTHRNILANIEAAVRAFAIGPDDTCLSFLPLSHVFERVEGYYLMLHQGAVIAYAESIDTVPANLLEIRPTIVISVPRLYEKMFARVMERVLNGPWLKKQLFFGAIRIGRAYTQDLLAGREPGPALKLALAAARSLVFSKLKERLGGRLRFFISGGAPLVRNVAEFFLAADIPIYEGYGLTETTAGITVNTPREMRLGTVGRPLDGAEVRLAGDGEIMVRGPSVFSEYWKLPEATQEAFRDGWFLTGDIGEIDPDGFLVITDRKKDLIVTAGGKNIAPQNLENRFKSDKYLSNAMVYGDRKPFLTALLVPNFENVEKYARYKKIDFLNHCDLVRHPRILDLIRRRVDRLQEELPSFNQVKRFTLLSRDFTGEGGEVTPTLKIKRKVVVQHFQEVLEGMYLAKDKGSHDSGFCIIGDDAADAGRPD